MLMLTVIAAIGLWYYYRPVPDEQPVHGGGKAIYHFKNVKSEDGQNDQKVRHGHYVLMDKFNQVEVRGFYNDGVPERSWTYYFPNGRKKMSGQCKNGARTGTWYRWNEAGTCVAQVTFGKPSQFTEKNDPYYISKREGPIKQWWPNGNVKVKGEFLDDHRHGPWVFTTDKDELVASGQYDRGRRQGEWKIRDENSQEVRTVMVINNREFSDIEKHLTELRTSFSTKDLTSLARSSAQLSALDHHGSQVMVNVLKQESLTSKLAIVHAVINMRTPSADLATALESATSNSDERVRIAAKTARYASAKIDRDKIFDDVIVDAASSSQAMQTWFAKTVSEIESLNLNDVERATNHENPNVRLLACDVLYFLEHNFFGYVYDEIDEELSEKVRDLLLKLRKHKRTDVARAAQLIIDWNEPASRNFGNTNGFNGCFF
jgi:antitoxin component YwqK of YwqJK toxin-antitoxin module